TGFWCAPLEGDTTLESYWIMLDTFLCRGSDVRVRSLARSIRERMLPSGGWAQYAGGPADLSVSCLSYFALELAGGANDRAIPPEMILLPVGGPFSIYDMSSWSRTIFVPLSIIYAHRPIVRVPRDRGAERPLEGDPFIEGEASTQVVARYKGLERLRRALPAS